MQLEASSFDPRSSERSLHETHALAICATVSSAKLIYQCKKFTHQIEPGIIFITGSKIIHSYIYISIHWWLITKIVWCTLPIPFRTNSRINKLQPIWTDLGPIGASFSHLITQPACGWLQNQLNGDCLYLSRPTQPNISPFRLIWAH